MDVLRIEGLVVSTLIGVREWERRVRQRVVVDLELRVDSRPAAASDRIEDAVDYGSVSRAVSAFVQANTALLVERLAEGIAALVLRDFRRVESVVVALHKPGAVPNARDVVLVIERIRA